MMMDPVESRDPAGIEKEAAIQRTPTVDDLKEKLKSHSHDADAAMKAFEGMSGQVIELSPEKNKELLRKIDWHLMPVGLTSHNDKSDI